jgi:hypothetical protein
MLHQDASRYVWLAGLGPLDLVATLDDATSTLYSVIVVEGEGTQSSFQGLAEVTAVHGLCCSLSTDRGSHYFYAPEAGAKVAKDALTQLGRALQQLGLEHIAAYSPEARGRSERVFCTLQDRLVKALALAGIRAGQYGVVERTALADPAASGAGSFCRCQGAGARIAGRRDGDLPRSAPPGAPGGVGGARPKRRRGGARRAKGCVNAGVAPSQPRQLSRGRAGRLKGASRRPPSATLDPAGPAARG